MEQKSALDKAKELVPYVKSAASFVSKHAVLFTLLLVLALQFVPNEGGKYPWGGMWMRLEARDLRIADNAAASSVDNFLRSQATDQVVRSYPNLPDSNRNKVIEDVMKKLRSEQSSLLDSERERLANEIRAHYQYESNGTTYGYMPDIDPYHYMRYARNILETGHQYDRLEAGIPWDDHMLAPFGVGMEKTWHPYVYFLIHEIDSIFRPNVPLMDSIGYYPIIFVFFSLIFIFFATRRLAGNMGGFFAVTVLALLPAVMGRTPWGGDNDAYQLFFPLLLVWLFVEAYHARSWKLQAVIASTAGLVVALFSQFWSGWWYVFDFMLGAIVIGVIYTVYTHRKSGVKAIVHNKDVRKDVFVGAVLFVSAFIFSLFTQGFYQFMRGTFQGALGFTSIKQASLTTLWPNVLTTVAELNPGSIDAVVSSVGGTLMFFLAVVGILLLAFKKDEHGKRDAMYAALLALWFFGTTYASLKGVRFIFLLGPAFAIAFGAFVGLMHERLAKMTSSDIQRVIAGSLVILVFGLIIVGPVQNGPHMVANSFNNAVNGVPIVNDAWWSVLTKIKDESKPDAIISSWWDFGHHFKFIANRKVTFDGASQTTPQAHWIGKVLQTNDEKEAAAIMRMLACGSNRAYELAENTTKDPYVSVKFIKRMIMMDEEDAKTEAKALGIPEHVTDLTHCEPAENFMIASADMIGKSGVWAHFGTWSFERAEVWEKWRNVPEEEAVPAMAKRFNMTQEEASKLYADALSLESEDAANQWISGWPGFIDDPDSCSKEGQIMTCGNIKINLTSKRTEVQIQNGVALAGKLSMYDKEGNVENVKVPNESSALVVMIWPEGSQFKAMAAVEPLADSMFTRMFYMRGLGLKHFKPFAQDRQLFAGMIYAYELDWAGESPFIPDDLKPKEKVEAGAQVKLNYIGWTEEGIFDASLLDWKEMNITPDISFSEGVWRPLDFRFKEQRMVPGFENGIEGMKANQTKVITVKPEEGYGVDPAAHQLGNKTLKFRIQIVSVQ
ncbi:FKBP-type peptidyl-prolyl cis-trans isomerase [Candidatus Woesearchaeota archaeon]|nr:FKBP-type peptidyl-prolyl cis-trans isomerase [Candidatus Woesearchaeota archaeon]